MYRILVVDDETTILDLLDAFLRGEGYDVVTSQDGDAALDVLNSSEVHLLITDTMMPRRGGVNLVRSMRDHPDLRDIPVIVMSVASKTHWGDLGVTAFLGKPFDLSALLDAVAVALGVTHGDAQP